MAGVTIILETRAVAPNPFKMAPLPQLRIGRISRSWQIGREWVIGGLGKRVISRVKSFAEFVEVGEVSLMDGPAIAKDERLEFDEWVDATIRDRRGFQNLLQLRHAGQPTRQVEVAIAVVSPLLIDPIFVLFLEIGPGPVTVHAYSIFGISIPAANLLVERGEETVIGNTQHIT